MATKLDDITEGEGQSFTVAFKDETNAAVVPNNVTYTLRNERDAVVNSRSAVIVSPATSINFNTDTSDNDPADGLQRYITINWDYDSTQGTGIKQVDEAYWFIQRRETYR
jgi:hypothetical protein